jgi:hypothetical protein
MSAIAEIMSNPAHYISAAFFGFILGFLVQRSRFCMTGAIRDYILFRIDRNLKMTLMILGTTSFFYTFFMTVGVLRPTNMPAGWYSVVGGVIFGIGMAIAGGCVISSFARIGEGSLNYLITAFMILVGVAIGAQLYTIPWLAAKLAGGVESSLLGSPYGLIWLGEFPLANPLAVYLFKIKGVYIGAFQALIFILAYAYLERKGE